MKSILLAGTQSKKETLLPTMVGGIFIHADLHATNNKNNNNLQTFCVTIYVTISAVGPTDTNNNHCRIDLFMTTSVFHLISSNNRNMFSAYAQFDASKSMCAHGVLDKTNINLFCFWWEYRV